MRVFFAGQALSLIGTWMQATAQSWLVWKLTHSTAALGTLAMFTFLPFLALAPRAGTWADRWDRRRLLIWLQVAALAMAFSLAVLVRSGTVKVWHLYVVATLLGAVATMEMASRPAFIGDLAGPALLRRAIALNSSMTQASRMVGPALAGVVIGTFGVSAAFWVNGASFTAVLASLLVVQGVEREGPADSVRHGFGEALSFLRGTPRLRELMMLSALLTFFGMSASSVFPAVADNVLDGDATTLGWLLSSSGAGALLGALAGVPLVQNFERVGLLAGGATIWAGIFLAAFSLSAWLPMSLGFLFLSGAAFPVVVTTSISMLQLLGPSRMRARLQSALLMATFGLQPGATLAIGWSARLLGAPLALRVNAVLMIGGAGLLLGLSASLREWRPDTPSPLPNHSCLRRET